MRVNSAFKGVLQQLASIAIVVIVCVVPASARGMNPDSVRVEIPSANGPEFSREMRTKQVNLLLRLIGHRLLMQAGDFTSRVLPVTEVREGTFRLEFEKQFVFSHDSLIMLADDLFSKAQFPSGYTVTVLDCMQSAIVYGFQVNHTSPDLIACTGRNELEGCYTIEFNFPDFYLNAPLKKETRIKVESGVSVKRQLATYSKPVALKTTNSTDIDKLAAELKTFHVEANEPNIKSEETTDPTAYNAVFDFIPSGILILLGVTLLIGRFGKNLKHASQPQEPTGINTEPGLPALGKFLFDVKGQRLLFEGEIINLTEKECKVLELLNETFGELIARETLMQKIWINEGVITGRSLDMFVSKLRKKLSSDPALKITNVHGKGYKLEAEKKT